MKVLVVTQDNQNHLVPKYVITGPLTVDEAVSFTREACLVLILADAKTAKAHQDQVDKLQNCVANSSLHCRGEKQVKTMEYALGTILSSILPVSAFPEPTTISYKSSALTEIKSEFNSLPEALSQAVINDLCEIFYTVHKKNPQVRQYE
jgi:hypothetical protein